MTRLRATPLRILLAASVLLVAVGSFSVASAPPAGACRCSPPTDQAAFDGADAVFTGTLGDVVRSTHAARFLFDVDKVFKGEVDAIQTVVTEAHGASCGLEISGPGPFVVIAFTESTMTSGADDGELSSHLCSGTRALADREWTVGVPGRTPVNVDEPPPSAGTVSESAVAAETSADSASWPWGSIAAGGAVPLVATIVWARRQRRRRDL